MFPSSGNFFFALSDIAFGAIVLPLFLVFCYGVGRIIERFTGARYARALVNLAPLIRGTITANDNEGIITGSYEGYGVRVEMTPERSRYSSVVTDQSPRYNDFRIIFAGVPGSDGWRFAYRTRLGFDAARWYLDTKDNTLRERLEHSDTPTSLQTLQGISSVEFAVPQQTLTFCGDMTPALTPSLEQFGHQLAVMGHLAALQHTAYKAISDAATRSSLA